MITSRGAPSQLAPTQTTRVVAPGAELRTLPKRGATVHATQHLHGTMTGTLPICLCQRTPTGTGDAVATNAPTPPRSPSADGVRAGNDEDTTNDRRVPASNRRRRPAGLAPRRPRDDHRCCLRSRARRRTRDSCEGVRSLPFVWGMGARANAGVFVWGVSSVSACQPVLMCSGSGHPLCHVAGSSARLATCVEPCFWRRSCVARFAVRSGMVASRVRRVRAAPSSLAGVPCLLSSRRLMSSRFAGRGSRHLVAFG